MRKDGKSIKDKKGEGKEYLGEGQAGATGKHPPQGDTRGPSAGGKKGRSEDILCRRYLRVWISRDIRKKRAGGTKKKTLKGLAETGKGV